MEVQKIAWFVIVYFLKVYYIGQEANADFRIEECVECEKRGDQLQPLRYVLRATHGCLHRLIICWVCKQTLGK